jgi:hypothetical protein
MARHGVVLVRIALGIVFVWFGAIKFVPGVRRSLSGAAAGGLVSDEPAAAHCRADHRGCGQIVRPPALPERGMTAIACRPAHDDNGGVRPSWAPPPCGFPFSSPVLQS